jgi:cell division septum initiation protein DivIVA
MMNILVLLDHLEELAVSNFRIAGKVMIDLDEFEELLEKIRAALPEEIKEAEWVVQEKDRYLEQAQEEAKRILREAEAYADRLVHEDQIKIRAEEEAGRILSEARLEAEKIEGEAFQYANQILQQLEEHLDRTLRIVRKGREEIASRNY